MKKIEIKSFYDELTATITYVVFDPATKDAVIIDPVLDYDQASSKYYFESVEKVQNFAVNENLKLHYCLETHAHADHLSGAQELKKRFPKIKIAIGERIQTVQKVFKKMFGLADDFKTDGSQFDVLLKDNEQLEAGSLKINVLFTPGHTPACVTYHIDDALFTGDAIFMPDTGTGRCDFPEGSSEELFNSISNRIYKQTSSTRIFVGHDYKANGTRDAKWETTVGEEMANNIQLKASTEKKNYISMRSKRDSSLAAPKLLLPSIQINIDAGKLPKPDANGMSYLRTPITQRKIN